MATNPFVSNDRTHFPKFEDAFFGGDRELVEESDDNSTFADMDLLGTSLSSRKLLKTKALEPF
jgi:hypothetical protein